MADTKTKTDAEPVEGTPEAAPAPVEAPPAPGSIGGFNMKDPPPEIAEESRRLLEQQRADRAQAAERARAVDLSSLADVEVRGVHGPLGKVLRAADEDPTLTDMDRDEAMRWFLRGPMDIDPEDEPDELEMFVRVTLTKRMPWLVHPVDADVIADARERALAIQRIRNPKATEAKTREVNALLVLAATVFPVIDERVAAMELPSHANPDVPRIAALLQRFSRRPGVIDQIAREAVNFSGYDDRDVLIRAAGN